MIVDILVEEHGKVPEAKVKQAPDELTGQAVVDAAKQWEFKAPPIIQGRQICYSSTLSFRFEIVEGKGKIVDDPINRRALSLLGGKITNASSGLQKQQRHA